MIEAILRLVTPLTVLKVPATKSLVPSGRGLDLVDTAAAEGGPEVRRRPARWSRLNERRKAWL